MGSRQASCCSVFSRLCVPTEGPSAAAVGGAAGLQAAEEEGPGVHLQQGPAEEPSGDAPWWTGQAQNPLLLLQRPNLLSAGPRQPRCLLGVGAGVSAVRHRDEERASAGAEQEAAERGRSGKGHPFLLSDWTRVISSFFFCCFQMEKNLALEDQMVHVLQQNEDLKVRIDNSQTLIQYVHLVTVAPCWCSEV